MEMFASNALKEPWRSPTPASLAFSPAPPAMESPRITALHAREILTSLVLIASPTAPPDMLPKKMNALNVPKGALSAKEILIIVSNVLRACSSVKHAPMIALLILLAMTESVSLACPREIARTMAPLSAKLVSAIALKALPDQLALAQPQPALSTRTTLNALEEPPALVENATVTPLFTAGMFANVSSASTIAPATELAIVMAPALVKKASLEPIAAFLAAMILVGFVLELDLLAPAATACI